MQLGFFGPEDQGMKAPGDQGTKAPGDQRTRDQRIRGPNGPKDQRSQRTVFFLMPDAYIFLLDAYFFDIYLSRPEYKEDNTSK